MTLVCKTRMSTLQKYPAKILVAIHPGKPPLVPTINTEG
jgi:hypothetical protein